MQTNLYKATVYLLILPLNRTLMPNIQSLTVSIPPGNRQKSRPTKVGRQHTTFNRTIFILLCNPLPAESPFTWVEDWWADRQLSFKIAIYISTLQAPICVVEGIWRSQLLLWDPFQRALQPRPALEPEQKWWIENWWRQTFELRDFLYKLSLGQKLGNLRRQNISRGW